MVRLSKEQELARLSQVYGNIIVGFLTEAVAKHEANKKDKDSPTQLIISPGLEQVVRTLDSTYGSIRLDKCSQERYGKPVVTWIELSNCVYGYAEKLGIPWDAKIYSNVIVEFIGKLRILSTEGIKQPDKSNLRYTINLGRENTLITQKSHSLEEGLKNGLISEGEQFFFSDREAAEDWSIYEYQDRGFIDKAGSKEDLKRNAYRFIAKETLELLGNAGALSKLMKSYVFYSLKEKGILINDFLDVVDTMVAKGVLIYASETFLGDSGESVFNFLVINQKMKPFRISGELLDDLAGRTSSIKIHKVDVEQDYGDPLGGYITLGRPSEKEFYTFKGPHGA